MQSMPPLLSTAIYIMTKLRNWEVQAAEKTGKGKQSKRVKNLKVMLRRLNCIFHKTGSH